MDGIAEQLLQTLRKLAPVSVKVIDAQEDARDIAVPNGRKRWSQVAATIEAMPWVRCELLDKAGRVLGYVLNEGAADALEDVSAPASSASAQARWQLELMLRAQQVALTYRDKEHAQLLHSVREILEVNTQSMREMVNIMRMQRDEAVEVANLRAAAENGGDMDQILKLIEASPKLMQVLGPLLMGLRAPRIAAAKSTPAQPGANGAAGGAKPTK